MRAGHPAKSWLILAGALLVAPGCGEDREDPRADAEAAPEPAAARQGAGGERTAAGADTAAARPSGGTAPAGTTFRIRLDRAVSMASREGDTLTAITTQPVTAEGGIVVPEGAAVHATVTAVQRPEGADDPGIVKLSFRQIEVAGELHPLYASVVDARPRAQARGGGAAGGDTAGAPAAPEDTLIGRILPADAEDSPLRETARLAEGTAIVLRTERSEATLPAGSAVELRLDEPLATGDGGPDASVPGRDGAPPRARPANEWNDRGSSGSGRSAGTGRALVRAGGADPVGWRS